MLEQLVRRPHERRTDAQDGLDEPDAVGQGQGCADGLRAPLGGDNAVSGLAVRRFQVEDLAAQKADIGPAIHAVDADPEAVGQDGATAMAEAGFQKEVERVFVVVVEIDKGFHVPLGASGSVVGVGAPEPDIGSGFSGAGAA